MNRRTALKQAALFAGGFALLPSCNFGPEKVAMALNHLKIDADHLELLGNIVETIIPTGEIPGGKAMDLHHFVLVMVDDCVPKIDQDKFVRGLSSFEELVDNQLDASFPEKDQAKNEEVLSAILSMKEQQEKQNPALGDVQAMLNMTKAYSIQGFMTSQYFMTEQFPYKLVPGPYQDCVSTEGLTIM